MTQMIYDYQKVWQYILDQIANGRTLTSVVAEPDMPSYAWCTLQLRNDPALKARYEEATDSRVEFMASEFIDLADSKMPEGLDSAAQSAWVQQLKLKLWARTWVLSKLRPRNFGDRLDVSVSHTQISITEALKQAEVRLVNLAATDVASRAIEG
jgi:hypothetical protein